MVTTSLDIAAWLVSHHDAETRLTNLSLNKLCFYAQVESLRNAHKTLFDDPIEAWRYGPVCPGVYRAYKRYGRNAIPAPATPVPDLAPDKARIMENTWKDYGWLSAYDLVRLSHRGDGAWSKAWAQGRDTMITPDLILESSDIKGFDPRRTFAASVKRVENRYGNTLRLLEDS
ncbi:Panacea domain-containing protein [Pseudoscardovia radai]|uniref:Panacea domain-containing protein n=1 Tax=Pseudoscardovia radai TaxID=987066 RepID=UPI0039939C3B